MKLTRFRRGNETVPAVFSNENTLIDCSGFGQDWDETFFENGGLEKLADWLQQNNDLPTVAADSVSLAPAVARPSKIVCVGLNYALHAKESGMDPPTEPVVFFKATSAWSGPNDNILIPRASNKSDWEVELAVKEK
jgi:2-keto-4-pentenoate hydratase/2-oxohepta-3-ene-1,7-dioic acid hydratase in catechol pathway